MESNSSLAVASYLGPPWKYLVRALHVDPSEVIRQIELAESALHFGRKVTDQSFARYNHERVLRMLPGNLPLHYKVRVHLSAAFVVTFGAHTHLLESISSSGALPFRLRVPCLARIGMATPPRDQQRRRGSR